MVEQLAECDEERGCEYVWGFALSWISRNPSIEGVRHVCLLGKRLGFLSNMSKFLIFATSVGCLHMEKRIVICGYEVKGLSSEKTNSMDLGYEP